MQRGAPSGRKRPAVAWRRSSRFAAGHDTSRTSGSCSALDHGGGLAGRAAPPPERGGPPHPPPAQALGLGGDGLNPAGGHRGDRPPRCRDALARHRPSGPARVGGLFRFGAISPGRRAVWVRAGLLSADHPGPCRRAAAVPAGGAPPPRPGCGMFCPLPALLPAIVRPSLRSGPPELREKSRPGCNRPVSPGGREMDAGRRLPAGEGGGCQF